MSEVKRYDIRVSLSGVESYESPCGDYVDYEDYAALEDKCVALAAENAWLKGALNKIASTYQLSPHIRGMTTIQTPATDAFLAEVRAQGVEMYAEHLTSKAIASGENKNHAYAYLAANFAAQLRKGGAV